MSVINQMLQDLEKRGDDQQSHSGERYLQAGIALSSPKAYKVKWVVVLLLGLLLGGIAWLLMRSSSLDQFPSKKTLESADIASLNSVSNSVGSELQLRLSKHVNVEGKFASAVIQIPSRGELTSPKNAIEKTSTKVVEHPSSADDKTVPAPAKLEAIVPAIALPEKSAPVPTVMIKEVSLQQRAESEFRQATVYQQQGRVNEAVLTLENALKLDSMHAPARQLLISILLENKRHEEAIRELKLGLSIEPAQLNYSMILARLLVERAKLEEAIDVLKRNQSGAQDRPDYLAFLAALQQKTAHHQEAVQLYRQALKKQPQNGVWWMGLGISLQAEADHVEAITAFKQAKNQSGLSPELHAFIDQRLIQLQK